jgi:hypothetical protein
VKIADRVSLKISVQAANVNAFSTRIDPVSHVFGYVDKELALVYEYHVRCVNARALFSHDFAYR